MGTLKMATAKTHDLSLLDSAYIDGNGFYGNDFTVSFDKYRSANLNEVGYAYKVIPYYGAPTYTQFILSTRPSAVYFRAAMYIDTYEKNAADIGMLYFYERGQTNFSASHITATLSTSSGVLTFYTYPNTVRGTVTLPLNSWLVLEVFAYVHDSAGRIKVRVNGMDSTLDFTGDTRNGVSGLIDLVIFGAMTATNNSIAMQPILYFDDFMIRDDTWCGTGVIELVKVNGNVAGEQDWTSSVGNAWACVDDVPVDWLDYISTPTATPGNLSLFTVSPFAIEPIAITAVKVVADAVTDLPGPAAVKVALKSGAAAVQYGALTGLSIDPQQVNAVYDLNPDGGGAWTRATVEALKIGVENG